MGNKGASRAPRGAPFVGREAELARWGDLCEAAAGGRGALVVISGDHGVGKTRLAREAVARAEQAGAAAFWGQGYDDEGSPAYWPWAEIISRAVERLGLATARRLMGPGARDITSLIPALDQLAPADAASREPPSHEARYRLFAAMRAFVQRAASRAPLVLVLDDLHYCDPDTLRLFEALAEDLEHSPVILVGTYVERRAVRHPVLPSVVAAVAKLPWCHQVSVGNLSEQDVRLLLEPEVGKKGSVALASSVHRQTEGNALFVVEALRAITSRALNDHWEQGAAGSIAMLINRRLARLKETELKAVRAAAVLGREMDLGLVAATLDVEPAAGRGLLAAPVDEGLLAETAPDRYRFAHELVQRAVTAGLAPAARVALHRAAGEALERLRVQGQAVDPAQLAWHFSRAGTEHVRKAAGYAREAGERALEAAAYDTALRHIDSAAAAAGLPPAERAELSRLRAWALFALTRFAEVAQCLVEAFTLYVSVGDIAHAVDVAAFDSYPEGAERLQREPMRRLRERALELVPSASPEAARLLCALAETLSYGNRDQAIRCAAISLETARRIGDQRIEARALAAQAWIEYRNLECPAFLKSAAAALAAARAAGDRDIELLFGGRLALWRLLCGDCRGSGELARELRATHDAPPSLWTDELQRAERLLPLWQGRWSEYARIKDDWKWARERGCVLKVVEGRMRPAEYRSPASLLADLEERPQYYINPDRVAMRAGEAADASRAIGDRTCLDRIRQVAERALAMELSPLGRLFALAALGFVGVLLPDAALLQRVCCPQLAAAPDNFILDPPGIVVDSVRGLLFAAAGRAEEARACFERALDFSLHCELIWELYATRIYYAAFLLRQGEHGRARELAGEALRVDGELAAAGFQRELAEVMSRLEGALPDGLTAREVEVVALAARGLATKRIAAELDISYFTVVNHLRHIYAKTGAQCRVDLAAYALRRHIGDRGAAHPHV